MPTQKELRATMSKKLQEAIKHPDPTVAAGRKSDIKRWVGVHIYNTISISGVNDIFKRVKW